MSLDKAKELTKISEGLKLAAYQDTGGVWTIGYGWTHGVHQGMTCTKAQAEAWLDQHYSQVIEQIHEVVKVELNDNQLGALCDFVYNLGIGQLKSSTLLKLLNAGDYDGALSQFDRWVYDNGQRLPGLVTRRRREKELWVTGDFDAGN